MKGIVEVLLLCMGLSLFSCAQQEGYKNEKKLTNDFLPALKEGGDALNKYIRSICPEEKTFEFMSKVGFTYRGFPTIIEENNMTYEDFYSRFSEMIFHHRERFEREGVLQDLKVIDLYLDKPRMLDEDNKIEVSSAYIKMDGNGMTCEISLGEIVKLDGVWKVFSGVSRI